MQIVIIVSIIVLALLIINSQQDTPMGGVIEQGSMARYGKNRRIDCGGEL